MLGEYCKAMEYTQQGLKVAKKIGNRCDQRKAYGNLAVSNEKQGDFMQSNRV
jgi:hypothetical protein